MFCSPEIWYSLHNTTCHFPCHSRKIWAQALNIISSCLYLQRFSSQGGVFAQFRVERNYYDGFQPIKLMSMESPESLWPFWTVEHNQICVLFTYL